MTDFLFYKFVAASRSGRLIVRLMGTVSLKAGQPIGYSLTEPRRSTRGNAADDNAQPTEVMDR